MPEQLSDASEVSLRSPILVGEDEGRLLLLLSRILPGPSIAATSASFSPFFGGAFVTLLFAHRPLFFGAPFYHQVIVR